MPFHDQVFIQKDTSNINDFSVSFLFLQDCGDGDVGDAGGDADVGDAEGDAGDDGGDVDAAAGDTGDAGGDADDDWYNHITLYL